MAIEIKVPVLPESVADAMIAKWYKSVGEHVEEGENLVDLETDKVMLEVPAPESGVIESISHQEGESVESGVVLCQLSAGDAAKAPAPSEQAIQSEETTDVQSEDASLSPAVRRLVSENNIDITQIKATGKNGRIIKEDVEAYLKSNSVTKTTENKAEPTQKVAASEAIATDSSGREEQRVPMSRLRARIAERLLGAKNNTAMLTTFNEINMKPVMDLRAKYKDKFEKTHDTRLGFMSFFTKATVEALKRFPSINASLDGSDIVYHGYFDVGIAISSPRGLVVPILRDVDQMSMADIEKQIRQYGGKAKDNKLTMEEMTGGTFTITNGGVFGSMLSTPILNPPQSAILGMHNIVERPVVENGEIVIRPIMYVALSYDHQVVDGRESVSFLVTIKELIEDPARLLLDI